jgi:hypothetical protein
MIKLTIAIPTVFGREESFDRLTAEIQRQLEYYDASNYVEVITIKDNKEITIGAKRQLMYEKAQGLYTVQLDDDDFIAPDYIGRVLEAIKLDPDCVTYQERCDMDGKIELANISLTYADWKTNDKPGVMFKYERTPFNICPIKTVLCLLAGMDDVRWAEDHTFSKRAKSLIKSEVHIDDYMYFYQRRTGGQTFKQRYGFTS